MLYGRRQRRASQNIYSTQNDARKNSRSRLVGTRDYYQQQLQGEEERSFSP
jgi:hypothetical protein